MSSGHLADVPWKRLCVFPGPPGGLIVMGGWAATNWARSSSKARSEAGQQTLKIAEIFGTGLSDLIHFV
eukprot:CAMPEP_0175831274 /NCGR_PEP_ID=MMETSP0107_2-20121207/14372_1 /TAXON_ID=195067 ORGANISM="Goniomonas pacifica, Strain CCMP1869" /NCGR_SAMPLE_ID=MMETSP0107_2 /ASSEMBLY_ACC=CAM_ASM_000203 /LENGTH=68 /DNA_ID=CAMNT_0017144291 /DNA_START=383 /DNA_END=589 /DNA_ORIENTATION=+